MKAIRRWQDLRAVGVQRCTALRVSAIRREHVCADAVPASRVYMWELRSSPGCQGGSSSASPARYVSGCVGAPLSHNQRRAMTLLSFLTTAA